MIKELQEFLKTNPSGIHYDGLVDGIVSPELLLAVSALESKIKETSKKDVKILSGDSLLLTLDEIKKLLLPIDEEIVSFLKTSPLGIIFKDDVVASLKELEKKIAEGANNPALIGKMVSGDKLIAPIDEVKKAVELIIKHKGVKTAGAKLESMSDDELNGLDEDTLVVSPVVKNKGFMDFNPATTQQIGKQDPKVPTKIALDERILELSKFLYE